MEGCSIIKNAVARERERDYISIHVGRERGEGKGGGGTKKVTPCTEPVDFLY